MKRSTIRTKTSHTAATRRTSRLALAVGVALLASCAAEKREVTTITTTVEQKTRVPVPSSDISIVDLRETPAENAAFIDVTGTIVNHGSAPVSELSVRIEVLDSADQLIDSVQTPPIAQTIAAHGGQAQFTARLTSRHLVHYRAVAIAR